MDITALFAWLPVGDGSRVRGGEDGLAAGDEPFSRALQAATDGSKAATKDLLAEILSTAAGEKPAALPPVLGGPLAAPDSAPAETTGEDSGGEDRVAEADTAFAIPLASVPSPQNFSLAVLGEGAETGSPRVHLPAAAPLGHSGPQTDTPLRDTTVAAAAATLRIPAALAAGATAPAASAVPPTGADEPLRELTRTEGSPVPGSVAAETTFTTAPAATAATSVPASTGAAQPGEAMPSAPAASHSLQPALASQPWSRELGQQLLDLLQRGDESVELQLNPRELGPLSVSLTVDDQGARAQFFSAQAPVRGAVEQAIPQLRDALAQQGIALGEATVGEQQQQHQRAPENWDYRTGPAGEGESSLETAPATPIAAATAGSVGGVDLYA